MEIRRKLEILSDAAKYDASCASSGVRKKGKKGYLGNSSGVGICHSYTPDGRCVSLLKILMTNFCIYDCKFCINRRSSSTTRARFEVSEIVSLTIEFFKRNYIEGLFLSSGIIQSADYTMEQLTEVARKLREEERFLGYIHLKAIPGADPTLISAAAKYADRLSANIELPTQEDLRDFAPEKSKQTIERTMGNINQDFLYSKNERKKSAKAPKLVPAGQSTQLIVGASPAEDSTILECATSLYKKHQLKRVYYSAFSPIQDADPHLPPVAPPLIREHRLYQADWLLRFYNFEISELFDEHNKNLSLSHDPKLMWAIRNPAMFPVDLNKASKETLLRIPGIGMRTVLKILSARRHRKIRIEDISRLRVSLEKVRAFIVTANSKPSSGDLQRKIRQVNAPVSSQSSIFEIPGVNLAMTKVSSHLIPSAISGEI